MSRGWRSKDVFVTFVLAIGAALVGTVFVVWIGSGGAIPISNAIVRVPSFFFAGLWIPQVLSAVATVWYPGIFRSTLVTSLRRILFKLWQRGIHLVPRLRV